MQTTESTHTAQAASIPDDLPTTYPNTWSSWQSPSPSSATQEAFVPYAYQQAAPPDFAYVPMPPAMTLGQQQPTVNNPGLEPMKTDSPEGTQLMDMGMMVSGESGMDEQWMSFMRESGIMDSNYALRSQINPRGDGNVMPMGGQNSSRDIYR